MELRLRHRLDERPDRLTHEAMLRSRPMSTAVTTRIATGLGSALNVLLLVVLAAAGAHCAAGLTAHLRHPPCDDKRAELTYSGDRGNAARLDQTTAPPRGVAPNI